MLDYTQQNLEHEFSFEEIAGNIPGIILIVDRGYKVFFINKGIGPFKKENIIGKNLFEVISTNDLFRHKEVVDLVFDRGEPQFIESLLKIPGQESKWYGSQISPLRADSGVKNVIISALDITSRKEEELKERKFNLDLENMVRERTEQLEKANKEIKVVLQEMHHRVKNNLQIVSSLLNIQSSFIENKEIENIFKSSQNRIGTMALIHEALYKTDSLSEIEVKEYLELLVSNRVIGNEGSNKIEFVTHTPDISFNIETMIPLSLILNELVTNSLKHAFPNKRDGEINARIKILAGNTYQLSYGDNGVGFPEGFNPEESQTLGLELIDCFISQIDGDYKFSSTKGKGVQYEFTFSS